MNSLIDCKAISKNFQQGTNLVTVFRDLNLSIDEGKTLAILGPSGSGKSTLLSLLAGLDKPDTGLVSVFNKDLSKMSEMELTRYRRDDIGIIFQQFNLFQHLTALENVSLPLDLKNDPQAASLAKSALDKVGLSHRSHHFPSEMSGGEMQRVAIARAIVTKPRLILADEPSGSLDHATGETVMRLLFDLVKENKTTLVLVTHNTELAERCDSIFHFERLMQ